MAYSLIIFYLRKEYLHLPALVLYSDTKKNKNGPAYKELPTIREMDTKQCQ